MQTLCLLWVNYLTSASPSPRDLAFADCGSSNRSCLSLPTFYVGIDNCTTVTLPSDPPNLFWFVSHGATHRSLTRTAARAVSISRRHELMPYQNLAPNAAHTDVWRQPWSFSMLLNIFGSTLIEGTTPAAPRSPSDMVPKSPPLGPSDVEPKTHRHHLRSQLQAQWIQQSTLPLTRASIAP